MPLAQQQQKHCDLYKFVLQQQDFQAFEKGRAWHLPLMSGLTVACSAVLVRTCCSTLLRAGCTQIEHEQNRHHGLPDEHEHTQRLCFWLFCSLQTDKESPESDIRACTLS